MRFELDLEQRVRLDCRRLVERHFGWSPTVGTEVKVSIEISVIGKV